MINVLTCKRALLSLVSSFTQNNMYAFSLSYIHNRHRFPNFKNPRDLSEICIKRVLDGKTNEMSYLADKYAVREYVESKGLGDILTPLLGVYEKASDINFDILPKKFALKANFGAGRNIICTDKSKLDYAATRALVDKWLAPGLYSHVEQHYNLIPKKFVCEAFIDDGNGGFPTDYKFMCIHGKVHCILACFGRENDHVDYLPYSLDWKPLYDYYRSYPMDIQLLAEPDNLAEMIATADKLSEGIDFVRIDLYSNGSRIWFGEVTLTPAGCIFHRWSNKAMDEMGKLYKSK